MIPFFPSVSQFHEGGQDAAATLSVAKGNEEEQVRVVCIYDTMVFVLHVVRACPYPQTTSPLASVYQTMSPNEWVKSPKKWVNDHLKGTVLKVKNKWWGPIHDNGKTTTCYIDSVALGNEFDTNDVDCKEDVNDRWVIRIKYPKDDQAPVDPDDVGIVENDPYPPEDESYYYEIMQYRSVLEYVDKNQPNYNDLYLPKESLVTYDIQVRIDHKPSISLQTVVSHHWNCIRRQIVLSIG